MSGRVGLLVILAVMVLAPPQRPPSGLELRWIDQEGMDRPCPPRRAVVYRPERSMPTPFALFEDLAYAAAAAGPEGAVLLLVSIALVIALFALWWHGFGCMMRRLWCTLALGVPLGCALVYGSSFLDGRTIQLGPDASGFATASLNTKSHYSSGVLSPRQLRDWHYRHGVDVLNIADRDRIDGAQRALRYNTERPLAPPMTVLVGQETTDRPQLVLVGVDRVHRPEGAGLDAIARSVSSRGGATIIKHPWSRNPVPIDRALSTGVEGVELINGVIHGGQEVVDAARRDGRAKALVGVTDYEFGPHLNAVTLIPRRLSKDRSGVVTALRTGATEILYAVPGGAVSAEEWDANRLQTIGLLPALDALFETPRTRRSIWVASFALIGVLWWLSIAPVRAPQLRRRTARVLFVGAGLVLLSTPVFLQWEVRAAMGVVRVSWLLFAAAPFAVIVLAASHNLALYQQLDGK